MAFLAQLTTQTEELVTAVTTVTPHKDPAAFAALREATLRSLRQHSFLRTNQFEVESQLDGLVERFSVVGRDAVSDALRQRRAVLAGEVDGEPLTTKWTPDILHFLLELADRPADQPNLLDDLDALVASRHVFKPPPLRWEDIRKEDGWGSEEEQAEDDEDDDVSDYEFGEHDEHDEHDEQDEHDDDDTTMSSVAAVDDQARTYRDLLVTDERTRNELASLLSAVRESQSWRTAPVPSHAGKDGHVLVSELQIVRETLFMLQGLETTLFGCDCAPVDRFQLSDVSSPMHTSLLRSVAASGRKLLSLRRRVRGDTLGGHRGDAGASVPLLQVFQEAIRRRLHAFDQEVSRVQARFIDGREGSTVVSLPAILDELQPFLHNLFGLAAVVQTLDAAERSHDHAFRYLEVLFDATSIAQYEGDDALYAFLGTLFFECFQVYLRPIRAWMEDGTLSKNDKVFFVSGATGASVPLHQIWHSQYKLLRTSSGTLHAPRFLQTAATKIFTTGKSIVVLRQLGRHESHNAPEPVLDFGTVSPPDRIMAPFAQLFGDAFERWIQSKYHAASATLQAMLFDACGLWASLEALHRVYLMADGAAAAAFASRVFHALDARNPRWLDRYTMTEMAREAFAEALSEESRLSVTVDNGAGPDGDDPSVARRSVRDGIARIRPMYRLAWPVQIIVAADTIRGYQSVFTLLLQIRRAISLLSRHRLLDDDSRDASAVLYFSLRARLLWFGNTLQSYLATLVIAPHVDALRADLGSRQGADVDAMIAVHAQFVRALVDEALLGAKLQPLHTAVLDLLDLALRLEDAHRAHTARTAHALHETWRLSVLSVPSAASPRTPRQAAKQKVLGLAGKDSVRRTLFLASPRRPGDDDDDKDNDYDNDYNNDYDGDDDDDDDDYLHDRDESARDENDEDNMELGKTGTYHDTLRSIRAELDSALRFVADGLRGVARASRNATAAAKWDMLAVMLGDDGSGQTGRSRW